ncbi:hypothetical protein Prudu_001343 [Prunus dulcis]|uniref:Uncharacterized protein n=1 Tax=Prunus dulcis TaxID=3755 RepID=A0A4Y1QNC5_PRUDU|nr:hypothetical protein Prudu_001343 [Prunus dulcis]
MRETLPNFRQKVPVFSEWARHRVRVKAKESLIVAIKSCQEERGLTVDVANGDKAATFGNHALTHLDIAKPSS